jgi:hypothetical protein
MALGCKLEHSLELDSKLEESRLVQCMMELLDCCSKEPVACTSVESMVVEHTMVVNKPVESTLVVNKPVGSTLVANKPVENKLVVSKQVVSTLEESTLERYKSLDTSLDKLGSSRPSHI